MESRTLLITGVSGYIGGSVLSAILRTKDTWAANLKVSALVRSESQATKVRELGVSPELFSSFDELDRLEEVGKGFDLIIHAGAGWHTPSAKALIREQGVRRQTTNADVHYIQISGTSNLSDRPHTEGHIDTHVFSDEEDIYSYEKYRESRETYFQRTTDIAVIEEGEAAGVTTYIVMAPTIFGLGSGPFNRFSMQLPTMIADALRTGSCSVVSEGDTVWNHVHIEDLAALHLVLLQHILRGIEIPSGRKGIYFCETGEHSRLEFSEYLAKAGHKLGVSPSSEVAKITIQEAGEKWVFDNTSSAELGFASNSRTKAVLARNLGWAPSHADEWESTFSTELNEFIKDPPSGREIPKYLKK
ncbi:NAD-dependent epimerase/dehydratase family protein [Aspergillus neoniger CBS 115656]|uniref:NAD dependent epimerase/dehydratase family protein n=1 Tax=Aspergillus neoniger (strain CBS 115656) TaxID=1448310 RepID=A0A318YJ13_ASPNB|nr:NAD dependent epimerase/dehydratase family protein [Aspergillus neoniger CBS 115656]PYH32490.1 NAD dependent epimerase/dehydratase family protein [Aspergillus neoniger CBS 115656]